MQLSLTGISTIINEQLESAPKTLKIKPMVLFHENIMEIMFSSIVGSEDNNNDAQLDSATTTFNDPMHQNNVGNALPQDLQWNEGSSSTISSNTFSHPRTASTQDDNNLYTLYGNHAQVGNVGECTSTGSTIG